MSVINLHKMFHPESVALVGASATEGTIGYVVMKNLMNAGFSGPVYPVNPKYKTVHSVRAYKDVASLPETPDLAVICTPAKTVPGVIRELGECGTRAAVILSAGFQDEVKGKPLSQHILDAS